MVRAGIPTHHQLSYSSTLIATIKIQKREKMQFLSAARQRFIIQAMQLYKKFKNIAIINMFEN